jgi:hypothetical protein
MKEELERKREEPGRKNRHATRGQGEEHAKAEGTKGHQDDSPELAFKWYTMHGYAES